MWPMMYTLVLSSLWSFPGEYAEHIAHVNGSSSVAKDQHARGSERYPYATVKFAVSDVDANTLILVHPGHTENVLANDWTWNAEGIWVQGMGWGTQRPTFTLSGGSAPRIELDQASCAFENMIFVNEVDGLDELIRLGASDCQLKNIEVRDGTGVEALVYVAVVPGCNRCIIDGITIDGECSGDQTASGILLGGDERTTVKNFHLKMAGSAACIRSIGSSNLMIDGGLGSEIWATPDNKAIAFAGGTTGWIKGPIAIRLETDTDNLDEAIVPNFCQVYNQGANKIGIVNADGESEWQWPGTISADEDH